METNYTLNVCFTAVYSTDESVALHVFQQDQKLNEMSQQVLELQSKHSSATATIEELRSQIQQLKDQNSLLKAQRGEEMFTKFWGSLFVLWVKSQLWLRNGVCVLGCVNESQCLKVAEAWQRDGDKIGKAS